MSHGEQEVDKILSSYNIKHTLQYPVNNPYKKGSIFKIDFAFKRNNHLYFIEYNALFFPNIVKFNFLLFFNKVGVLISGNLCSFSV